MNRLVIIGNGFDLAHGLPTSYKDFIDDYWRGITSATHNDDFISFENISEHFKFDKVDNLQGLANYIMQHDENIKFSEAEIYRESGNNYYTGKNNRSHILVYKNEFFKIINEKSIENWVDIENEYYFQLKKIANFKSITINGSEEDLIKKKKVLVKKLNEGFKKVRELLDVYLNKIFEKYDWFDVRNNEIEDHLKEEPNMMEFLLDNRNDEYYQEEANLKLRETLLLSFNYTRTVADYSSCIRKAFSTNYIHGEVNNKSLPIIFGFGDEMDENYAIIENIDDNVYLEYFKSIQYLEHSNYKELYNFIESEPFQVFIMGHSCGLSDRTLLSMIFENQYCLSVKVFYHQKTNYTDNYTEIIQNISRHFKDKKMLRNKVVEKRHCKPLIKFIEKERDLQF